MPKDIFLQRKKAVLLKSDKSSAGELDKKIIPLCRKINKSKDFYTTSSCSGRIVLMLDKEKKSSNLFLKKWHDIISFSELKDSLDRVFNKNMVKFKLESPIIHIACRDLKRASELLEKAKHVGFKRSGILTAGRNIILELNSTEKLEFPISINGETLVDDNFLEIIVQQAEEKLQRGWEKIEKLKKIV